MLKKGTFIFFILIFISRIALSQGIRDSVFQMREVLVAADRIFKKENAGQTVTEVDSTVLEAKINQSLSGLLSENTPVFIKSQGRGALATASFRGTAASHTQVTWNGININSPMTGMVDFSLIPVYIIDDLNLQHGASSIASQSGGLGGAINLGNRVDWNNRFRLRYLQGIGSYSTYDEFLDVSFGNRKFQSRTRIYHSFSENDYTFTNHGIANIDPETGSIVYPKDTNDRADYTKYGLLQELYWRISDKDVLSAKYWWQSADRTIPRATTYEGPDNSNLNDEDDVDHNVVADWKHYWPGGNMVLRTGYSAKDLDYEQRNQVPGSGLVAAVYSVSKARKYLNHAEYNYTRNSAWSFRGSIDFNYEDVVSGDSVQKTGYDKDRNTLSALLSASRDFSNRLNLNIMLRQDWVDGDASPLIPFLGFDYRLIKNRDLIIKGNVARNYHRPTLNDLYWQPGGNPGLNAEEGITAELGLKYQLMGNHHSLKSELTFYRSDIDHWIVWIPSYKGFWTPMNIKNVLAKGIEVSTGLNGSFSRLKYHVQSTYAYTSSVNYGDPKVWGDESYGKQLVYVPLHSFNLLAGVSFNRFYVSWQHNTYSDRYTTTSNDVSKLSRLYSYYMNDLVLGKDFSLHNVAVSAKLKINNLFDEAYHSVLYRPMPGRNYLFLLMFKF
jgi:outer membrane cobalamin receptor